jgi:hypothetical protein
MPVYHNWGFPRLGSRTGQNVYGDLMGVKDRLLFVAYGVSVATSGSDAAVVVVNVVPGGYTGTQNYRVRSLTAVNASTSLAAGPTLALWTGAGGTGTNLITAGSIAGCTTSLLWTELTTLPQNTIAQANTIYIRVAGTGVAGATVDVYVYGDVLP